ncbi:hypothetical protein QYE76_042694 [Lolium multiflorum]|uniref:Transposase (putative) gypsy type domain-containing protein n=1 Tax=Lolium multiflorum TaxID=4521 RepID=A0AAD8TG36_LOLMU|nr:hypothetical protein QYE76_042694 [Lolium multiflorum]
MAAKIQESENKRASKARIREGERGQWWPCETTDVELRELQNEGMISPGASRDTDIPKPGAGEVVMTRAWVERGLSLPCSEFFLSILNTYGLQPHNICPNSYLLLSNFATLCEGHLGIRPDVKLWQFFFRVKKETKDKAMLNCGSMTFMLRPGRMYPPHDSHESVRYWNAGWFYEKNASVPDIHDGLPKFINEPPEELASWSFVPSLAQTPILEKAARRISWLHSLQLDTLAEENFRSILRVPVSGDAAEEVPDDEEEEEEQAPRKAAPRPSKRPRAKASGSEAGEASAKKPKTMKPPPLNSKKAERERLKMLSTAGKRSRPIIPGAPNPTTTTTRTTSQEPITNRLPLKRIHLPLLPRTLHRKLFRLAARRLAEKILRPKVLPKKKQKDKAKERLKSLLLRNRSWRRDVVVRKTLEIRRPHFHPKAYATKFFNKLTEAEKWELEQDLLNAMLNNARGKPDAMTSEIQDFKKDVCQLLRQALCKQRTRRCIMNCTRTLPSAPRYPGQAESIRTLKNENAELNKQLADAQGTSSSLATTSSQLENLRSSYQELETKLMEAEQKREQAEKQLAEKNSEFIKEKGEFVLKKNADSETIKRQQKELNGLRKYMETAERHWDLLNEHIFEPLGYPEVVGTCSPDDLRHLCDDCKDLISAPKICHNLSLKKIRTRMRKLVKKMDILPDLTDLQASSARAPR